MTLKIDVKTPAGKTDGSVELPAALFDVEPNIALMHQAQAVKLGVKAILNFAPTQLVLPDDVVVKTVNLALELETLSYGLTNRG